MSPLAMNTKRQKRISFIPPPNTSPRTLNLAAFSYILLPTLSQNVTLLRSSTHPIQS